MTREVFAYAYRRPPSSLPHLPYLLRRMIYVYASSDLTMYIPVSLSVLEVVR